LKEGRLTGEFNAVDIWTNEKLLREHSLLSPVGGGFRGTS
jgi:hypothetical protein